MDLDVKSNRVLRGGCWNFRPSYARVADRGWDSPGTRNYYLGFRLYLEIR
jgi:formylglycine-generating enzyme required for sulfatase activity